MYKLIALLFFSSYFSLNAQNSELRFHKIDLTAAKQRAVIEDKLIFIDTYTSYCRACKQLDIEFKNPKLAKFFNKNFINVKVDMNTKAGKEIKNKYEVVFLPTILIIDQLGNQRYKLDNLISADELLSIGKYYQEKYYPSVTPVTATTQVRSTTRPISPPVVKNTTPLKQEQKTSTPVVTEIKKVSPDNKVNYNEKILYVLGQGGDNLPPEILKQEAYFKMEFMDGSHLEASKKYLATQEDWSTEVNQRFLYDFLYTVKSPEFEYFISNKESFSKTIGEEPVSKTINILVTKELEKGYPRPNLQEAEKLYGYTNAINSKNLAAEYNLNNIYEEGNFNEFVSISSLYLENNPTCKNAALINKLVVQMSKTANNKKKLRECLSFSNRVLELDNDNSDYILSNATLQYKLGNKKEAWNSAKLALQKAQEKNQTTDKIDMLLKSISEL